MTSSPGSGSFNASAMSAFVLIGRSCTVEIHCVSWALPRRSFMAPR